MSRAPSNWISKWSRYRTAILLSSFIVAGWLWDLALGGGVGHAIGWLIALLLVGGISALAARASTADQPATDEPDRMSEPNVTDQLPMGHPIRQPGPAEFDRMIEIEQAADKLFEVAGYGPVPGPASLDELAAAELLLVAGDPAVGYARVEVVDGQAHLECLSVRPKSMRQGIGSALVRAACDWATAAGYTELTLCTFAEVPWNGPFYATLGFTELAEPTPGLLALRATEQRVGLDAMGRRIVMVRQLTPEAALPTE
jgi:GNAT superfamily N-acetyltransferase